MYDLNKWLEGLTMSTFMDKDAVSKHAIEQDMDSKRWNATCFFDKLECTYFGLLWYSGMNIYLNRYF